MELPKGLGLGLNSNSLGNVFDTNTELLGKAGGAEGANKVGPGVLAAIGGTPMIATIAFAQHMTRLSNSLLEVGPDTPLTTTSFQDIEVLIASVLDKMQAGQEKIEKNKVTLETTKQSAVFKEKAAKLDEAISKQAEAQKNRRTEHLAKNFPSIPVDCRCYFPCCWSDPLGHSWVSGGWGVYDSSRGGAACNGY